MNKTSTQNQDLETASVAAHKPNRRRRQARREAPDWFGCGHVITTESWERFKAARAEYYAKLDAANASQSTCTMQAKENFEQKPQPR